LGIRNLLRFNHALLSRLWCYKLEREAWWRAMVDSKYGSAWGGCSSIPSGHMGWVYGIYIYIYIFLMNNSNLIEKKRVKTLVREKYTIETQPYKPLQCKKLIKSTKFVETKLGTLTRTQPKRDLKKEDFRKSMFVSLSLKIRRFLFLQMLIIKRVGITFQIASLGCLIPYTIQQ
jgi:hypothetical protein